MLGGLMPKGQGLWQCSVNEECVNVRWMRFTLYINYICTSLRALMLFYFEQIFKFLVASVATAELMCLVYFCSDLPLCS